jgi:hypothetical protein
MSARGLCCIISRKIHLADRRCKYSTRDISRGTVARDRFWHGRRNSKDTNPQMSSLLVNVCFRWCSNFVGFESGQKQSVKLLQNMVYNTTQHPPPPPPQPHTVCIYFGKGERGGGQREGRKATVHKRDRNYQHDWLYLWSLNSIKHQ